MRARNKEPSQRQLRVGAELQHALVEVLARGDARDPELRDVSITISQVTVSPDLKHATAYVMTFGGANLERVLAALRRANSFFRYEIAKGLALRHVPKIAFEADHSFETAARIEALLRRPEVARDLAPPARPRPRRRRSASDAAPD
jgi:ribosome-binding factor A